MKLLSFVILIVPLAVLNIKSFLVSSASVDTTTVTTETRSTFLSPLFLQNDTTSADHAIEQAVANDHQGGRKNITNNTDSLQRVVLSFDKICITKSRSQAFDEEVIFDTGTGNKVWRVSNAMTSMVLTQQPFCSSSSNFLVAGESTAILQNGLEEEVPNVLPQNYQVPMVFAETPYFHSHLKFKSATGSAQHGLTVGLSAAPKQGDARLNHIVISDNGESGLDVFFYDATAVGRLVMTALTTNLNYADWHELDVYMSFVDGLNVDGSGNDIVDIYINGRFVHTGTSYETFYLHQERDSGKHQILPHAVDSLMFQLSGNAAPNTKGGGLFFDNIVIDNAVVPDDNPSSTSPDFMSATILQEKRLLQATSSPIPSVSPTSYPTESILPSESPSRKPTRKPTPKPTPVPSRAPTRPPSPSPSVSPSVSKVEIPSTSPTAAPIEAPSILGLLDGCGTCDQASVDRVIAVNQELCEQKGYACDVENQNRNCNDASCVVANSFGRAVRTESFTVIFRISKVTTADPDDELDSSEAIDLLNSNAATVSTILTQELGTEIVVEEDARVVEAPSSAPSQSPAPSITQMPSVSLRPTRKFEPSASPSVSQFPSSSPTTRSSRTFQIISSFKFDDSLRDFCLNAMKFKVGGKVKMRPCRNGFRKQMWFLDDFDQLRLRQRPDFCLTYRRRDISLAACDDDGSTKRAKFFYDKGKGVIFVQKRRRTLYVGLEPNDKYGPAGLYLEGANDSLDKWLFV